LDVLDFERIHMTVFARQPCVQPSGAKNSCASACPPAHGMGAEMVIRKTRKDDNERGMLIYAYKFMPVLQRN
jgi:hypothetical protein